MDLQDISYFCAAAELEHITQAADILGLSQPFLSKVIKRLEEELGTTLFDHVGRTVVLNDFGRVVYNRGKLLLSDAENLKTEIAEMQGIKDKTISVVTNTIVYLPRLLNAFYAVHKDYTVLVTSAHLRRVKKALAVGSADFAFCSPPMDEDIDLRLKTDWIFDDSAYIMLPSQHPLRLQPEISVKALHGEKMIISPQGFGMRNYVDKVLARNGVNPRFVIEIGEVADIIQFVRQGIGCAFMPTSIVKRDKQLQQDCFPLVDIGNPSPIGLSYYEASYMAEAKRIFRDFTIAYFQDI